MNGANPAGPAKGANGQHFGQQLVNQQPVYDRDLKIKRPRKKKKEPKWV
jgi:hypothetical protein